MNDNNEKMLSVYIFRYMCWIWMWGHVLYTKRQKIRVTVIVIEQSRAERRGDVDKDEL